MGNKKNILLRFIVSIVFVMLIFVFWNMLQDTSNNDTSITLKQNTKIYYDNTIPNEPTETQFMRTKKLLEEKGFSFTSTTSPNNISNFTYFSNGIITMSAYIETDTKKYIVEFRDKSIGEHTCGITDTSINTTEEKNNQYNSYLKWKDEIGLSQEQLNQVLIVYYLSNN